MQTIGFHVFLHFAGFRKFVIARALRTFYTLFVANMSAITQTRAPKVRTFLEHTFLEGQAIVHFAVHAHIRHSRSNLSVVES